MSEHIPFDDSIRPFLLGIQCYAKPWTPHQAFEFEILQAGLTRLSKKVMFMMVVLILD